MTDTTPEAVAAIMPDELIVRLRLMGDRASYEPHMYHVAADALETALGMYCRASEEGLRQLGRANTLAADRDAQKARADAAERERDELVAALDTLESDAGITANGNMWRFWAQMARDEAKQAKAANVARKATEAKVAKLVEALIWTDMELAKLSGLWFDVSPRKQIRAIIAEVQG